jgi:carbamoyl-phosphate synthase large subunit
MAAFTHTVAITALNATDNPGPGVAVARALRADPDFQGRILGLAYDAFDPGLFTQGLFDACYILPYATSGRQTTFDRLAYVAQQMGPFVLIPNLDLELPAFIGQEAALRAIGVSVLLPDKAAFDGRAKAVLHALSAGGDIPVPRSRVVVDSDALADAFKELGSPLVVKGAYYGAQVCHSLDEAIGAFHKLASKWGLPIIVQEFVEGDEVVVCAVGDGRSGLVGAVTMKKLMITDIGKGWAGVSVKDPGALDLTRRIVRSLSWKGPLEVELRKEADDRFHLLEINPRFPAWVDLCQAAGCNLPLGVARMAMGQAPDLGPDVAGKAFVRISIDQMIDIQDLANIATTGEIHARPKGSTP